jgi:hypothetical protein
MGCRDSCAVLHFTARISRVGELMVVWTSIGAAFRTIEMNGRAGTPWWDALKTRTLRAEIPRCPQNARQPFSGHG